MGRDDWPRLIVVPTAAAPAGETYHRYRPATGWESPRDEQGALASTGRASGYYGVLGRVDPEVLCVGPEEVRTVRMSELLPHAFGPASLT